MVKNSFPAGPGSSPAVAPATDPGLIGVDHIVERFSAIPAAKAASDSVTSRPRDSAQPGRPGGQIGVVEAEVAGESMRRSILNTRTLR